MAGGLSSCGAAVVVSHEVWFPGACLVTFLACVVWSRLGSAPAKLWPEAHKVAS